MGMPSGAASIPARIHRYCHFSCLGAPGEPEQTFARSITAIGSKHNDGYRIFMAVTAEWTIADQPDVFGESITAWP